MYLLYIWAIHCQERAFSILSPHYIMFHKSYGVYKRHLEYLGFWMSAYKSSLKSSADESLSGGERN